MGEYFFDVNEPALTEGRTLVRFDSQRRAQAAVIDVNAARTLFADGTPPIGQTIFVRQVRPKVLGVLNASSAFGPPNSVRI